MADMPCQPTLPDQQFFIQNDAAAHTSGNGHKHHIVIFITQRLVFSPCRSLTVVQQDTRQITDRANTVVQWEVSQTAQIGRIERRQTAPLIMPVDATAIKST